ncbi:MAG: peptide deformylase [Clostridia bacterium]|nr:peptide deformylase [Clostridia bacterium]
MAIREIRLEGDPCLKKVCREVEKFDERLHVLLDDMKDTLIKSQGVGLAAPQVGILKRVFVIDTPDGGMVEFVNPTIVSMEGSYIDVEGCLSLPGKAGNVERPVKTTVKAFDRNGKEFEYTGEDLYSKCICHENDHLDGILYAEKVIEWLDLEED